VRKGWESTERDGSYQKGMRVNMSTDGCVWAQNDMGGPRGM
jgi:hypothetical protein